MKERACLTTPVAVRNVTNIQIKSYVDGNQQLKRKKRGKTNLREQETGKKISNQIKRK